MLDGIDDQFRGISTIMISNNHGNFDEVIPRIDEITYNGVPCLFGAGDPRQHLERFHFIRNLAEQDRYINLEAGLAASPAMAGWWSSQWTLEQVDINHFRLKNRWTDEYLHMQGGALDVGQVDPSLSATQWMMDYVGGSFLLKNLGTNQYLRVTSGALTTSSTALDNGALWDFCN